MQDVRCAELGLQKSVNLVFRESMAPYFTIPVSAQPKLQIRCTLMYNTAVSIMCMM